MEEGARTNRQSTRRCGRKQRSESLAHKSRWIIRPSSGKPRTLCKQRKECGTLVVRSSRYVGRVWMCVLNPSMGG